VDDLVAEVVIRRLGTLAPTALGAQDIDGSEKGEGRPQIPEERRIVVLEHCVVVCVVCVYMFSRAAAQQHKRRKARVPVALITNERMAWMMTRK
jgi:hypothetical protein